MVRLIENYWLRRLIEVYYNDNTGFKIKRLSDIEKVKKKRYVRGEPWICPKCKRVWQHYSGQYGKQCRLRGIPVGEYLRGFPKIGCTPKICEKCK